MWACDKCYTPFRWTDGTRTDDVFRLLEILE